MVRPLADFKANPDRWIDEVRSTGEALLLTDQGKDAAVVLEARSYEKLLDELDLLREVRLAEQQIAAGQGIPHDEARQQVLSSIKR